MIPGLDPTADNYFAFCLVSTFGPLTAVQYLGGLRMYHIWRRYQLKCTLAFSVFGNQVELLNEIRSLSSMGVFPGVDMFRVAKTTPFIEMC